MKKMQNLPLVLVCLPIYNSEITIRETLDSILSQTYSNILIYISYDSSDDKTLEIVSACKDTRVIISKREANPGLFENMNHCIRHAQKQHTAKYVTLFNGDDVYSQSIIQEQVNFLERNVASPAVFTEGYFIDEFNKFIGVSRNSYLINAGSELFSYEHLFFGALRSSVTCLSPSFMVRQKILANNSKLIQNPELFGQAADFGLFLTIAKEFGDVGIIRKPLLKYRIWSGNSSAKIYNSLPNNFKLINFFLCDPRLASQTKWIDRAYIGKLNLMLNNAIMQNLTVRLQVNQLSRYAQGYTFSSYLISLFSLSGIYNIYKYTLFILILKLQLSPLSARRLYLMMTPDKLIIISRILRNFWPYIKQKVAINRF